MLIRALAQNGHTSTEIVARTGFDLADVEHVTSTLGDTREGAKNVLRANAHRLAQRIVEQANVEESLEVLDRLDVAPRRDRSGSGRALNIGVIVGASGQRAGEAPVFDLLQGEAASVCKDEGR